jgi:hypothetical protein
MASASRARRYCSESSRIAHTQVLHFSFGLDGCVARGFPQSFFKTCDANGNVTGTVELPPARVAISGHREDYAS